MHGSHSHDHGHGAALANNERRMGLAASLTGAFMFAEVAGGIAAGSLALLADAGHMLTDFASLALAWFGFRLSRRPADWRRTYGFDRFLGVLRETIASIIASGNRDERTLRKGFNRSCKAFRFPRAGGSFEADHALHSTAVVNDQMDTLGGLPFAVHQLLPLENDLHHVARVVTGGCYPEGILEP